MTGSKTIPARAALACLWLAQALAGCGGPADDAPPPPEPFDLLIVGGQVYDGSLSAPRTANLGIIGETIASVAAAADAPAKRVIDAGGKAVMPGFIDPHTHALDDLLALETRANLNYLLQGVTTVFVGNDGAGVVDRPKRLAQLRSQGTGSNVAFFAGHNELRRRVLGDDNRPPSPAELQQMREHMAAEMDAGALGLSTGLFYTPGSFADTAEVIELARVAAQYGGVYDSHMRSESSFEPGVSAAVREVLTIAEQAEIPAHIAHLKALGSDVWGRSGDLIALIDEARGRGLEITADQYPYRASGTRLSSALVPQWARADSREAMFQRYDNPDLRPRLREEMTDNLRIRGGPGALLVTGTDSEWRGMTLSEIAADSGRDHLDAAMQVIRDGDPSVASFVMDERDIHAIAIQPWVMTGSDGSEGHPRKYGTYPQAYRDFVVDNELLTLPQFVHRSAGLPADFFGLCDRGYIAEGRKADIVVIDLEHYRPRADFENPTELASGVSDVLVNGRLLVTGGAYAGLLPGAVIDRQALACAE